MSMSDVGIAELGETNPPLTFLLKICQGKYFELQPWSCCSLEEAGWYLWEGWPGTWWAQVPASARMAPVLQRHCERRAPARGQGKKALLLQCLCVGSASELHCCKEWVSESWLVKETVALEYTGSPVLAACFVLKLWQCWGSCWLL